MARFKRKTKTKPEVKVVSLFDAIYSKQTKDVKIHAGLMDVFYSQSTSKSKLAKLKRKHKRVF